MDDAVPQMMPPDLPFRTPWREPEPIDPPQGILPNLEGQWMCIACGTIHPHYVMECDCGEQDTAIVVTTQ